MPRLARVVVPGCPHRARQRGSRREEDLFCDKDRPGSRPFDDHVPAAKRV